MHHILGFILFLNIELNTIFANSLKCRGLTAGREEIHVLIDRNRETGIVKHTGFSLQFGRDVHTCFPSRRLGMNVRITW